MNPRNLARDIRTIATSAQQITVVCVLAMLAVPNLTTAQDTLQSALPPVEIQATRAFESTFSAARSVYVMNREQPIARPGLSLQRSLRGLPGIRITDRGHYGLGERVIVRGMGYRAAFGVRGVQAFLNGVPLTVADGQSMLDVVDPAFIRRAELLRGPSSIFWGNASGGVLFLSTAADSASTLTLRYVGGSHGLVQTTGSVAGQGDNWNVGSHISWIDRNGYRDHSEGGFVRFGTTGQLRAKSVVLSGVFNLALQDVNSPGSLTAEQFLENPRQADPRYIRQGVGKESQHILGGLSLQTETRLGILTATAYHMERRVENPLTYAWIKLDRNASGAYAQLQNSYGMLSWSTGGDFRYQHDQRLAYDNDGGNPQFDRVQLDQFERVRSAAAFATAQARLTSRVGLTAGVRVDRINFSMSDYAYHNDDQSGSRAFSALSHSVGSYYRAGAMTLYLNRSTSFESPTTTEFINTPVVAGRFDGGFNPDLGPQRATGYEAGLRGHMSRFNVLLDLAGYHMSIQDRLVPQQAENGRTWYRNAGRNRHQGVEMVASWPIDDIVHTSVTYNYSLLRLLNHQEEDLYIPGIPKHNLQATLHVRIDQQWVVEASAEHASSTFADQANQVQIDPYTIFDLYGARDDWRIGNWHLTAFARIQNILNNSYIGSLIVNAFGGRYFEPSAERSLQVGLALAR